jgi:sugar phosphate isomerase/epimerase
MAQNNLARKIQFAPSRRALIASLLGAAAGGSLARAKSSIPHSKIHGVMIGAQAYSFRDRPLDAAIQAFVDCGLSYAELSDTHLQPKDPGERKKWRVSAPESFFHEVRSKFDKAGVHITALGYNLRGDFSAGELEYAFKMVHWLGLDKITSSSNVDMAPRLDQLARKYKVYFGFHNHASMKPNEFSTPRDFETALAGNSHYLCVNLDIGHATAAGWDPLDYLNKHHARIISLHLKNRAPNQDGKQGANLPWDDGPTNIKGVLLALKQNQWPIPAHIEYEYGQSPAMDSVVEVKKCYEYCKRILA